LPWTPGVAIASLADMLGRTTRTVCWLWLLLLGPAGCAGKGDARQAALVYVMLTGERQGAGAHALRRDLAEQLRDFQLRVMEVFSDLVAVLGRNGDCRRQLRRALAVLGSERQDAARLAPFLQRVALALGREEVARAWQTAGMANLGAFFKYDRLLEPGLAELKSFADRCPVQAREIGRAVSELFQVLKLPSNGGWRGGG